MEKMCVIQKYFKGKAIGTIGGCYKDKNKADSICKALIEARPSDMLNYKVFET